MVLCRQVMQTLRVALCPRVTVQVSLSTGKPSASCRIRTATANGCRGPEWRGEATDHMPVSRRGAGSSLDGVLPPIDAVADHGQGLRIPDVEQSSDRQTPGGRGSIGGAGVESARLRGERQPGG